MLKALMLRKASMFGQEGWLNVPWQQRRKTAEQELYDYGFRLAALLDRADQLVDPQPNDRTLKETIDLLDACNALQGRLEDLFTESFKSFLQEKYFDWTRSQFEKVPNAGALTSADTNQVMIVVNLWSCQLLLGFVAEVLRNRAIDALDSDLIPPDRRNYTKRLCETCAAYANQNALSDLAHAILRYLPLCLGKGASEFAASRTLFPLTCVLWQLRHKEIHFRRAMSLMRQVAEARNVRIASGGYSVIANVPFIARDGGGLLTAHDA